MALPESDLQPTSSVPTTRSPPDLSTWMTYGIVVLGLLFLFRVWQIMGLLAEHKQQPRRDKVVGLLAGR